MTSSTRIKNIATGARVKNIATTGRSGSGGVPFDPVSFIGFVDTFPGPKAAYSIAYLLNTGYSGSCIRVRRSSDDAEQDIGFSSNELDTATMETFAGAGDAFVTTVYDQENSFNLTAPSNSAQPKIVDTGSTVTQNGKPAALLDGTDDTLFDELDAAGMTNPNSLFVVFSTTATISGQYSGLTNISSRAGAFLIAGGRMVFYQQGAQFSEGYVPAINTQFLDVAKSSTIGTDYVHRNNGSNIAASKDIGTLTAKSITIGNRGNLTSFANMYFQECIVYNSDKSADFTGWETQINGRYGIY